MYVWCMCRDAGIDAKYLQADELPLRPLPQSQQTRLPIPTRVSTVSIDSGMAAVSGAGSPGVGDGDGSSAHRRKDMIQGTSVTRPVIQPAAQLIEVSRLRGTSNTRPPLQPAAGSVLSRPVSQPHHSVTDDVAVPASSSLSARFMSINRPHTAVAAAAGDTLSSQLISQVPLTSSYFPHKPS